MLLYLSNYLSQFETSFTVFNYITIRAVLGALTALIISFLIGPKMIKKLNTSQLNQPVRQDGPESHLVKAGTPTMGGAMILLSVSISTLLWSDINNSYIWIILFVTISFGLIGYIDDYKKIIRQNSDGISAWTKIFWQSLVALIAAIWLYSIATDSNATSLLIPYLKDVMIPLGIFHLLDHLLLR